MLLRNPNQEHRLDNDEEFEASLAAAAALEEAPEEATEEAPEEASEETPEETPQETTPAIDDIKQSILDGDLDGAVKALGLDPKVLQINGPKFRAMRQGLKQAKEAQTIATARLTEAQTKAKWAEDVIAEGKAKYGDLIGLKHALKAGEFTAARDILEALLPEGASLVDVAKELSRTASEMSASERLYRDKLRKLAASERKVEEPPAVAPTPPDPQKNLEGAKRMLEATDLKDVPGAAEALVKVAAQHWDAEKKGFRVPRSQLLELVRKDAVVSQLLELRSLKAAKQTPKAAPVKVRERGKLTPEQSEQARQEAAFRASILEAAALERAQMRRGRP